MTETMSRAQQTLENHIREYPGTVYATQGNGKIRLAWYRKAHDYIDHVDVTMSMSGIIHNNGHLQVTGNEQVK